MSTLSEAKKLLKDSERESKINVRAVAGVLGGGLLLWLCISWLGGGARGDDLPFGIQAQREMPTATAEPYNPTPTVAVIALEPTSTPWPTPIILEREIIREIPVEIEVTREVAFYVPGPEIEVTRVVTVEVLPPATPTPIPLAPGTIKVCVDIEGAKEVYIGGRGVVSGGCELFQFGPGQTTIGVQVNR
jgi:hypothetical protein